MTNRPRWLSPILIQCIVTAGVSLNMSGLGVVMGFATILLPQLREPNSPLVIDDESGSWIASVPALSMIAGNFMVPVLMSRFGRKLVNLTSLLITLLAWVAIGFANSISYMITIRFIQGIGMGIIAALGPVLIGEYTSPKNRGAFLMTVTFSLSLGILSVHSLGSFISWQTTSLIIVGINLLNVILILLSPESPTFLADKGKYDECRKIFRYLRGNDEDEELEKIIAASITSNKEKEDVKSKNNFMQKFKTFIEYWKGAIVKKEVYKPVIIMFHVYAMSYWSGVSVMTSYTSDYFERVSGTGLNIAIMVITLNVNRTIVSVLGLFIIKMVRRRILMFIMVGLNITVLITIAIYTYAKENHLLTYDHPMIGVVLINIQMFSIAAGALPISFVIAGEIFPREFKGICGGISTVFLALHMFLSVKTVPIFFKTLGVFGSCCVMGVIMSYCLLVVGLILPETKDRTLQDIEEEFKGKVTS